MIEHDKIFVIRIFRGTYKSVRMLKGYMAKKKNGKPCSIWCKKIFVFNNNFMFVKDVHYISRNKLSNLLRTSQGECHCSGSWLHH